ncbi:MAG: hypothetical protein GTO14_02325 [Anaerolineales bacterium]|nr:hypothetical protein [Anaerolineales bacterium]
MPDAVLAALPEDFEARLVLDHLTRAFERLGDDPQYLTGMQMVAPGVGELYGVKVPVLRDLARGVLRMYGKESDHLRSLALESWERGSREHKLLSLFILAGLKDLPPEERWKLGVRFLPDVTNWEICDQLCMALLGQALTEEARYMDVLETWVADEDLWVRRAALVAPVYLRRAKYPDELARALDRRVLSICKLLLDDPEHYIRKAVDWSIRQVLQRHYDLARDWMMARTSESLSKSARSTLKMAAKKLKDSDQRSFRDTIEHS